MCNLYSVITNQQAIRALFGVTRDEAGNMPPLPAIFPDQLAPVVWQDGADRALGGSRIAGRFEQFSAELPAIVGALHLSPDELTFSNFATLVSEWLQARLTEADDPFA